MNSKEALDIIKKYNDYSLMRLLADGVLSPETIGSPTEKDCKKAIVVIEQDLEVLEILKKYLHISKIWNNQKEIIHLLMTEEFEEYSKIKELLENE